MNKTKIDWCDSTFNPVTGCLHGCEYCYAREMVKRYEYKGSPLTENGEYAVAYKDYQVLQYKPKLGYEIFILDKPLYMKTKDGELKKAPYPFGFRPTFHRYRLNDYINKKGRTIFVGSMCDLFGEWVPDGWIQEIFKACEAAPQHRYLFLTKNPKRYKDFFNEISGKGYWLGSTATTCKADVMYDTSGFQKTFISAEPIMEDISPLINDGAYESVDWVIIGAETGNRKDKVIPKKEWIQSIAETCKSAGVPVFMKESLRQLMSDEFIQEFPW